jgi:hypothetical protein
MQFDRRHGRTLVVTPAASACPTRAERVPTGAQVGPDVSLRRTDYDFQASAEAVRQSGYPEAEQHVVALFLEQPGRDEVTKSSRRRRSARGRKRRANRRKAATETRAEDRGPSAPRLGQYAATFQPLPELLPITERDRRQYFNGLFADTPTATH